MTVVVWHDVECGSYEADLPLWEELAAEGGGEVLDLGCGSGRVALHLARRSHPVVGLDRDPELVAALTARASAEELPVNALVGDAAAFSLDRRFATVLAPMQLAQLLGPDSLVAALDCIAAHLAPAGKAAFAIVEELGESSAAAAPAPDVGTEDGWTYSSLPVEARVDADRIVVRRLRQTIGPAGQLSDELDEVRLARIAAGELERMAAAAGLSPCGRRVVPPSDDHVGSTVVILERS